MVMVVNTMSGPKREALDAPRVNMTKIVRSQTPEGILSPRKDLIDENVEGDMAKSDKFIRRRRKAPCRCDCRGICPGCTIVECSRTRPSSCIAQCEEREWRMRG